MMQQLGGRSNSESIGWMMGWMQKKDYFEVRALLLKSAREPDRAKAWLAELQRCPNSCFFVV